MGLNGRFNNAVKQRKVNRASEFTVASFGAVIGECLRNKDGTQGTCCNLEFYNVLPIALSQMNGFIVGRNILFFPFLIQTVF